MNSRWLAALRRMRDEEGWLADTEAGLKGWVFWPCSTASLQAVKKV